MEVMIEIMIEKINSSENYPNKSYTKSINKHKPHEFSISINFAHDESKYKNTFRLISSSISDLIDNLSDNFHKQKWLNCNYLVEYLKREGKSLICNCPGCSEYHTFKFDSKLKNKFANIFKFYDRDLNEFIILSQKGVYPYKYVDIWLKFHKTSNIKIYQI